MANHKSAIKRHKQSEVKRIRNRNCKSALNTQLKKAKKEIANGSANPCKGEVVKAVSTLAKASGKGVLHRKTASRLTSRLMKAANKAS